MTSTASAESPAADLSAWLTRPLPAADDGIYNSALANVQELDRRLADVGWSRSVAGSPEEHEEIEAIVTDLDSQRAYWTARLSRAAHDLQADADQSARMQGPTKSVLDRNLADVDVVFMGGRVLRTRPVQRRIGCGGRPAAKRTTTASRGGDSGDPDLGDEPPRHRPPSREGAVA